MFWRGFWFPIPPSLPIRGRTFRRQRREKQAASYTAWHTAYEVTLKPHTPTETAEKNRLHESSEKDLETFVNRFLRYDPAVTEEDKRNMGVPIRDTHPTPSGVPTTRAIVETFLEGRNQLGVNVVYVSGDPDDPANAGFRIWYTAQGPDEPPPAGPEDLHKSFFTHRKKNLIEFDYHDSGKTAWFSVVIENGPGKQGSPGALSRGAGSV
jgi:hypothetical protein